MSLDYDNFGGHMIASASVVLFNNSSDKIIKLVESLNETDSIQKVHIFDNSELPCLEYLFCFDKFVYTHTKKNLGFGGGHNLVLHKLESEFHFIINPDIYFAAEEINKMILYMQLHENVGLLSPQILFPEGEIQYLCKHNPTIFALFLRRFAPNPVKKIFKDYLDNYEMRYMNYLENFEATYLSGCFMMFRSDLLIELKGFDDNFFLYLEDADITLRASKHLKTLHYADAKVFHFWEKGSYKSIKLAIIAIQSLLYYFKKYGLRIF